MNLDLPGYGFLGIDFETYSDVDLKERGLFNYATDPSFTALIADIDHPVMGNIHYDFILTPDDRERFINDVTQFIKDGWTFTAQNAGFERMVFRQVFGMEITDSFIDSAVYARMLGSGEKLEVASRQLSVTPKMEEGRGLIMLFCVPNYQNQNSVPSKSMVMQHQEEWVMFGIYCGADAKGSRELTVYSYEQLKAFGAEEIFRREAEMELVTYRQNINGWPIDRKLIQFMSNRAWANSVIEQQQFFLNTDTQLNFNSPVQLKKYCEVRGFPVKSLDKYQLPIALARIEKICADGTWDKEGMIKEQAFEVKAMLLCKQELGGSSLSKLQKILNLSGDDDLLRDQYVHVGAGQTYRSSGRGVQMQNLKKLDGNIRDMETVYDFECEWTNADFAGQLRQVFRASHDNGELLVGDFASVESRATAHLAEETWKEEAYHQGLDVYKVLFTKFKGNEDRTVDSVTAEERPRGKYSELSCGYQASGKALQEFMFRLGFVISIDEAAANVADWRYANPKIVDLWYDLDRLLKEQLKVGTQRDLKTQIGHGLVVKLHGFYNESIQEIHPGALSLNVQLWHGKELMVNRVIHGCYMRGGSIIYYKPAEHLGGPLWSNVNVSASQKAKKEILLSIYGGKLTGILVQSLCRELFFDSMWYLQGALDATGVNNARLVGQFHDEVVVDWWPPEDEWGISKDDLKELMSIHMGESRLGDSFPLTAEIKSAFRYIK